MTINTKNKSAADFGNLNTVWLGLKDHCYHVADMTSRVDRNATPKAIATAVCDALNIPADAPTFNDYWTQAFYGACRGTRS